MKYEKRAECTNEVLGLIDLANLVPYAKEVKDIFGYAEQFGIARSSELIKSQTIIEGWLMSFLEFPLLVSFLCEKKDFNNLVFGFQDFQQVRRLVFAVVKYSESYRDNLGKGLNTFPAINLASSQLWVNRSGRLEISLHRVHESLINCELHRFRRCVICNNVFWAKKLNAETCQKKCRDTLGNRKRQGKARSNQISAPVSEGRNESRRQFLNQDFSKK